MRRFTQLFVLFVAFVVLLAIAIPALAQEESEPLTVYSGRSESLIGPILERFTEDTGIEVEILYGGTAAVANQILEEGELSPADVFIAQDGGALGALAKAELLAELPDDLVEIVPEAFRSPDNLWVGVSGRARVLVYNPESLEALGLDLPESIFDLTGEDWNGLVGWAPTNASFQAQVTAMRVLLDDETALSWLEDMVANGVRAYEGNTQIVEAVINGEIPVGLVNQYYLFRFLAEDADITTRNYYFPVGDLGSLVNVAGAAILATSDQPEGALALIEYLLSDDAQQYFADETYEYPMIDGIEINELLTPLDEIESPEIDLTDIDDLEGTLEMIEESGALDS
jgi:iron(III) transport system substrate-binding protein